MIIDLIIQELNYLIEKEHFEDALQLVNEYKYLQNNVVFNDAYASVLYFLDDYDLALKVLQNNLHLILNTNVDERWLEVTYFQIANCYAALGSFSVAKKYYNMCLTDTEQSEIKMQTNCSKLEYSMEV